MPPKKKPPPPAGDVLLILNVRSSRRKALELARLEAEALTEDRGVRRASGGPLSEDPGHFWLWAPEAALPELEPLWPRLGYTQSVKAVRLPCEPSRADGRYKGQAFALECLHEEDADEEREKAPDRRDFALPTADGSIKVVKGYRGDGSRTGRRALPVADARLLANLARVRAGQHCLEPFAGAGGIAVEMIASGAKVATVDQDPVLRFGLRGLGATHVVARAERLPFAAGVFAAIASEAPFDAEATPAVVAALSEFRRVLRPGAFASLMSGVDQAPALRDEAVRLGFQPVADSILDRKGTAVAVQAWRMPVGESCDLNPRN